MFVHQMQYQHKSHLLDPPFLVGVYHELPVPADGLPHDGAPPDVVLHVRAHLQLEVIKPIRHELFTKENIKHLSH